MKSTQSNVISVNFTQASSLAHARSQGILGAWIAGKNPYVQGGELWKAFNAGRRTAASFAPLPPKEYVSWNPVDYSREPARLEDWTFPEE